MTWPHDALVLLFTLAAGCSGEDPVACSTEARSSLVVEVTQGGKPVCDAQVTVVEVHSQQSYELNAGNCAWAGPYETAGTFDVTATAPTGSGTTQNVVVVTESTCHHVETQHVTVAIE